jgi:hypothetical protein
VEGKMPEVKIQVKCSNGNKFEVAVDLEKTVGDLKASLVEQSGVAADQMRLIYRGHVLKDGSTLQSYCEYARF